MSTNKKKFGSYSDSRVSYNNDGATVKGRKPRKYKQGFFTCGTAAVILLTSAGIVYLMYHAGIAQWVLAMFL